MATKDTDPHADMHGMSTSRRPQREPVKVQAKETLEEKVDRINRELITRINDVCTGVDKSVQALTNDVHAAQTAIADVKDAIAAHDVLIMAVGNKADAVVGKAQASVNQALGKIANVETGVNTLRSDLSKTCAEYAVHTHDVVVQFSGRTTPAKPAGGH